MKHVQPKTTSRSKKPSPAIAPESPDAAPRPDDERHPLFDRAKRIATVQAESAAYHAQAPSVWSEECLLSPIDLAYSALSGDPRCIATNVTYEVSELLELLAGDVTAEKESPLSHTLRAAARRLRVASELSMRGAL